MLKFYKSMTLLNTMDRILYESQRQVGGDRLGVGGAWNYLRSSYLCVGQKTVPKEERVEWRSFVLRSFEFLGFFWGSGGRMWEGPCPGAEGWTRSLKTPNVLQIEDLPCREREGRRCEGPFREHKVLRNSDPWCSPEFPCQTCCDPQWAEIQSKQEILTQVTKVQRAQLGLGA